MTETPTQKRNQTADLLKGFAVIFMIQVHVIEQFATPELYESWVGKISLFLGGPFCAPVFLAVMGYFLAMSKRNFWYFIKRGIVLFVGGIALNLFRSTNLLLHLFREEILVNPYNFIFGADILTLAGMSLIFIGFMRLFFKQRIWGYIVVAVIVVSLTPFLPDFWTKNSVYDYIFAFLWGNVKWSYFPLFPWIAYILVGYAFKLMPKQYVENITNYLKNYKYSISLLIILLLTMPYAVYIAIDLTGKYYHHGFLFFAWTLLFMLAYTLIMRQIEIKFGNTKTLYIVQWMGKNVTLLYVIQWLIVGNAAAEIFKTQNLWQCTLWFLAISVVTCIAAVVYKVIAHAKV